ncbi:hypothetical protein AX774_g4458 [Zancudomyces culisetae]|uniref:Uncharacterized protein n=1 Tax=Zancudomyces culisetae TaxID=1213189 RepID=A0A1R1PMB2_ZANCU|nr:hypothetical protein AX774_g4458 [Zancudomyces culisetae]|eukprot:OMH82073.1 hypothetical protein AX774_g4458 [Zancudomyces culisetae]
MTEVQTKDLLVEEVQRLKDDLRDLNVELSVARKHKLRQVGRVSLGGFGANQGLGDNSTKDSAFSNIVSKIKTLESQIEVATNSLGPLLANRNNHRSTTLGRPILQPRTLTSSKKSMNDALLQKSPNLNSKSSSNIIPNFNHSSSLKKSHTQHQALLNTATRNIEPPKFQRDAAMRSSLSPVTTGLKQPTQIANKIVDFAGMSEASRLRIARSKALRAELRSNSSSMFNKDNKQQRVTENA